MKNILFLLVLICIAFIGCDGKERVYKSNVDVLKAHKLLDSFSEKVEYIPEQYTEVVTDTLLSNGDKVSIKFYSDMENATLLENTMEGIKTKTYFRKFISDVTIHRNAKIIFNETIDHSFLLNKDVFKNEDVVHYGIRDFWIESQENVLDGATTLYLEYINVKTEDIKLIKLSFLKDRQIIEIVD